jgi:hypothetical protein
MSALCSPCRAIVDENPFAVLFRRDEWGNYILCHSCRRLIWRANENAANGHLKFDYSNPNSSTHTHTASNDLGFASSSMAIQTRDETPDTWVCTRCCTRIDAPPRAYQGQHEPKDWWWCRDCQSETRQSKRTRIGN